jgi:hypothetical protein
MFTEPLSSKASHTAMQSHRDREQGDLISLILFYKNKKIKLKCINITRMESHIPAWVHKDSKCILWDFEPLTGFSCPSIQAIPLLLRNPKVHYRVHRSPAKNMAEVTATLNPLNKAAWNDVWY